MNIGMTGGIGSGKSSAAKIFEELGFYTLDLDEISRRVMAKGEKAYEEILAAFGQDILTPSGEIDRKKLGNMVFNDKKRLKILESIVHPAIFKEEKTIKGRIKGKDPNALIITHAALMAESGNYKNYDILITIRSEENLRIKRVMKRDGLREEDVRKIIAAQSGEEEKIRLAHIIINNDGNEENLKKEVSRAANLIRLTAYAESHR